MSKDPPLRDNLPPEQGQWSWTPLAVGLGWLGLFVVYVLMYLGSGYPNARAGVGAFVPVSLYLIGALILTIRRRSRAVGSGLLIGLGVWLLIGGGPCIADLVGRANAI